MRYISFTSSISSRAGSIRLQVFDSAVGHSVSFPSWPLIPYSRLSPINRLKPPPLTFAFMVWFITLPRCYDCDLIWPIVLNDLRWQEIRVQFSPSQKLTLEWNRQRSNWSLNEKRLKCMLALWIGADRGIRVNRSSYYDGDFTLWLWRLCSQFERTCKVILCEKAQLVHCCLLCQHLWQNIPRGHETKTQKCVHSPTIVFEIATSECPVLSADVCRFCRFLALKSSLGIGVRVSKLHGLSNACDRIYKLCECTVLLLALM